MSRRIGNFVILEPTHPERCSRCLVEKECRDVLGNGTRICFDCATPNEKKRYGRRLFADPRAN